MGSSLINTLNNLSKAFQAGNMRDLKRMANNTIKEASMNNDPKLAKAAVIAYAFYKIYSKEHITSNTRWQSAKKLISASLDKSIEAIQKNNEEGFQKNIQSAVKEIQVIDDKLSNYAENIFEKAKIKQASTAYALGLSIGRSAELTGADPKDLQKYIGFTRIHDEQPIKGSISERLKTLKELLEE